jgi:hypothetical protein
MKKMLKKDNQDKFPIDKIEVHQNGDVRNEHVNICGLTLNDVTFESFKKLIMDN